MKIQYICEFTTLARLHSFLKAAEELHISQATLSRHIKRMEEEMGVLLFERTTRHVCLTKEGRIFLSYAIAIQDLYGKFKSAFHVQLANNSEK